MSHHILQLEGDCMEQEDRDDWIKRLEARRDEEIQQMFAENSDSECICIRRLPTTSAQILDR